jgi:hypothetical protein
MSRGVAAAVALAAVAGAATVSARAVVVPGTSLAGVSLGQTQATVRTHLGAPPHVQAGAPGTSAARWDYPAHNRLGITFNGGRVVSVVVTALRGEKVYERTSRGVGLLSPMSAVSRAYPGACVPPQKAYGSPPRCFWRHGHVEMSFETSGRYGTGWNAPVESIELTKI